MYQEAAVVTAAVRKNVRYRVVHTHGYRWELVPTDVTTATAMRVVLAAVVAAARATWRPAMQQAPDTTGPWPKPVTVVMAVTMVTATNVRREVVNVRVPWSRCVTKPRQAISGAATKAVPTDAPEITAIVVWAGIHTVTGSNCATTTQRTCVSTEVGARRRVRTDVTTTPAPNRRSVISVRRTVGCVAAIRNVCVP